MVSSHLQTPNVRDTNSLPDALSAKKTNRTQHQPYKYNYKLVAPFTRKLTKNYAGQPINLICYRRVWIIGLLIILSGCSRIILDPRPTTQSNQNIINPEHYALNWNTSTKKSYVVGYQFVGPLPLGKISIESASLHFYSALQAKLLEHGLLLSTTSSRSAPRITFKTISLNAYDLLITRRVVCQAETLVSLNNQEDTLQIELSSYHNLPFERELSTHLRICLKELAREVIKKIVIYPFQMKKS